jgi:hypothetical protein
MKVNPELEEIVYGKRGMLKGIDVCLETQCLVSAVSLILSAIDALSALTRKRPDKDTDHKVFECWTKKYIQPEERLGCTAKELYSARCAVLHNYGSESRLTRRCEAKPVVYKWRSGPSAGEFSPIPDNSIVICIEDLNDAFRQGLKDFLVDAEMDSQTKQMVNANLKTLLCYKPYPFIVKSLIA